MEETLTEDNLQDRFSKELGPMTYGKFLLLNILTFYLYQLWWMYKAWRFFREEENSDIRPAFRATFGLIYLIPLLNKILRFAKKYGYTRNYSSILIFLAYLSSLFFASLASFDDKFLPLVYVMYAVCMYFPLKAMNYGLLHYKGERVFDNSYNGRQKVIVVIGGAFWFLIILGLITELFLS